MAHGPLSVKPPPAGDRRRHPAPARRAPGSGKGVLGKYLVLSPKGNIADVGRRGVDRAAPADPGLQQARGRRRAQVRRVTGAGYPSAPATSSPRAALPPGGERPAQRRQPPAEPGSAPPPSPPARRPEPARALPKGRPGASRSARRRPVRAQAPHRVRRLRGPARRSPLPAPSLGSSLGSSQISESVSHARPSALGAAAFQRTARSPPSAAAVGLGSGPGRAGPGVAPAAPDPPASASTPHRAATPPRARSAAQPRAPERAKGGARDSRELERDTAPALTQGRLLHVALPGLLRRLAPSPAPRPAGPGEGDGGGAQRPGRGWQWSFRSRREGAQTVLVSPRRFRAPGGGQGCWRP